MNLKDVGWMYHAPQRKHSAPQDIRVPPVSQIPNLGNMPDDLAQQEPALRRGLIKPTDTPYMILCKQGGRADLLNMKHKPEPTEQKNYQRCDWYYLEDNREELNKEKEEYQFRLPEYMIHKEYQAKDVRQRTPTENFVSHGINSQSRESFEPRPEGYGVRLEKLKNKEVKFEKIGVPDYVKHKPESDMAQSRPYAPFPQVCNEEIGMSKLLAHGYASDWLDKRKEWNDLNCIQSQNMSQDNQHNVKPTGRRVRVNSFDKPKYSPESRGRTTIGPWY